ncbi:MAG TPA: hypothetical protein VN367_04500 [Chlorobaculum sp.]|nr:hypothetical protein [Chlorobaculum sp.]
MNVNQRTGAIHFCFIPAQDYISRIVVPADQTSVGIRNENETGQGVEKLLEKALLVVPVQRTSLFSDILNADEQTVNITIIGLDRLDGRVQDFSVLFIFEDELFTTAKNLPDICFPNRCNIRPGYER